MGDTVRKTELAAKASAGFLGLSVQFHLPPHLSPLMSRVQGRVHSAAGRPVKQAKGTGENKALHDLQDETVAMFLGKLAG